MLKKKMSAVITAIMMCLILIPSYVSADDAITLTVLDATAGHDKDVISNLIDGSKKTSWGMNWKNGTTTAYAVIKASRQVAAQGYTISTGEDASSWKNRNPRDWKLYGCNDYDEENKTGGKWILLDEVNNDSVLQDLNSKSYKFYFDNNTAYSFYKLEVTANKGNDYLKISEFELLETASFSAVDGKSGVNSGESYSNLFDGSTSTKYCVNTGEVYVVAKYPSKTVVTGYTFTTGNDTKGEPGRNPKSWVLYGSNDYNETSKEGTWNEVHSVTDDTTMQAENYTPYSFSVENNTTPYKYYKFEFNEVQSGSLMQLSEIQFEHTTVIHNWADVEKAEPTCTEAGFIKQTCTDCGTERTLKTEALGHVWTDTGRDEPTCTEVGHIYQKCSRCEATKTTEIPVIEHDWAETSKDEPTCFDQGMLTEKCTACGKERETVLAPLGHIKGENNLCARCGKQVIRIGDTYYFNLPDAVNAAENNQTIEILQNITIDGEIGVSKNFTVELNGFTIKQTGSSRLFNVYKTLTLRDSSENRTGTLCGGTEGTGGGIYVNENAVLNMIGGTISDCTATSEGGGIFVKYKATLNMSDSAVIKNCSVRNLHGGGIMNYGTAEIKGSKIINCNAKSGGGGIYTDGLKGGGKLDLYNTVIEECSVAMNGGGGICTKSASVTLSENTVIRKNTAPGNYGAGICATNYSTVNINNSKIEENTANEGAGILANTGSNIILNGSEITGNSANSNGGGIMLSSASLTVESGNITENISKGNGGGIMLSSASLTVESGNITENISKGNGGGIYAAKNSDIKLKGGSIDGNSAQWGGGVYLHYGSEMTVSEGSYIKNNTAANNGGGIIINDSYNNKNSALTMTGGNISHNEAIGSGSNGNGGGICGQKKAIINISGGTIDCNKAINGGGIFIRDNSSASISGGHVLSNFAKSGNGGGVYIDSQTDLTLTGGAVSQNTALNLGGGIYVNGTISVSGAPQVSGNRIGSEEETGETEVVNNIYLPDGKTVSVLSDGLKTYLGDNGYIEPVLYVTAAKGTAVITGNCADYSEFFRSDNTDYAVFYEDNAIKLVKGFKVTFIYDETYDKRTETVVSGHCVSEPESEPYKDGYTFIGWLKDGKDFDFSNPITQDITLTAKWAISGKTLLYVNFSKVYAVDLDRDSVIYLASYDKNGMLIDARIEKISDEYYPVSISKSFKELGLNTENAVRITAFLWDENMKPLCDKNSIELN